MYSSLYYRVLSFDIVFFFKQKTAYEMRISDWSSDVCSSDLIDVDAAVFAHVCSAIGDAQEELDPDDPQAVAAVARLREECTIAKEGLSLDSEARDGQNVV